MEAVGSRWSQRTKSVLRCGQGDHRLKGCQAGRRVVSLRPLFLLSCGQLPHRPPQCPHLENGENHSHSSN